MSRLGIKIRESNYNPRAQAKAERAIQVLTIHMLREMAEESHFDVWSKYLGKIEFLINSSPCSSLGGYSPFQLTRRTIMRGSISILNPMNKVGRPAESFNELAKIYDKLRAASLYTLIQSKNHFAPKEALVEGQIVFRRRLSFSRNLSYKLQVKVVSAFEVVSRVATGLYRLRNILTNELIVLPIDQLIRTSLTKEQMVEVLAKIAED